ncbi:MAG TPA: OpgC domain-containing protein [Acidobacteriaceae bacterium]|nr:OpgC domain-containing protein [Acidobacteriaceae bacterium]
MTLKTTSVAMVKSMQLPRKPEFDALRGLFLVWMTLTHLPTRISDLVNQPFGFISSAEGFVFLSALLVGRVYMRQATENAGQLRSRLWKRALRVYAYHVSLLLLAFTFAAAFAVYRHHAALEHLLDFYIAHPAVAIVGSLLLIYCPPLLDILPMYVIFLLASPLAFSIAVKRSWLPVIAGSTALWLLAQFGLRAIVQHSIVSVTHLPIPLQQWGAFNLFAWQWVWIMGMWMGARSVEGELPLHRLPKWTTWVAGAVCLFFVGVRHDWLGANLTQEHLTILVDKWQLGPLRVLNIIAFVCVLYSLRGAVRWVISREPFITLGRASIEVFCAHLLFVFVGLALLYGEVPQLHGVYALSLLTATFIGLLYVAQRQVRRKHAEKERSARAPSPIANTAM